MPVVVPKFSAVVAAQPLPRLAPMGVVAGLPIANAFAGLSNSISENRRTKDSILSFADIMSETDPQSAKVYRAMADNVPLFDPDALSGGGGGRGGAGSGGGPRVGGMQGMIMSDMMDALKGARDVTQFGQKEAIRSKYDQIIENLRHSNDLSEIDARGQIQGDLLEQKQFYGAQLEQLREAQKVRQLTEAERMRAQKLQDAYDKIDYGIKANAETTQQKLKTAQQNADTATLRAATGLAKVEQGRVGGKVNMTEIEAAARNHPVFGKRLQEIDKQLGAPSPVPGGTMRVPVLPFVPSGILGRTIPLPDTQSYPDSDKRAALLNQKKAILSEFYSTVQSPDGTKIPFSTVPQTADGMATDVSGILKGFKSSP